MPKMINILIAEDERYISMALRTIVSRVVDNADITMVYDGTSAANSLKKKTYHMVISDWNMPGMSGVQLLQSIRSNKSTKTLPFLMLTARGDRESVMSALEEGVTEYIAKPFNNKMIGDKISTMLSILNNQDNNEYSGEDIISILSRKLKDENIVFPVLPDICLQVIELTKNKAVTNEQMTRLIKQDTALSSKVITVANSPLYSAGRTFTSIEDAVTRVGLREVSGIVVALANKKIFSQETGVFSSRLKALWEHSFSTAVCSKLLAERMKVLNNDRIFAMALLHDIGKLLLLTILHDISSSRNVDDEIVDVIMDSLHVDFGTAIVERWKMPQDFIDVVGNHHDLDNMNDYPAFIRIVCFSNLLVRKMGYSMVEADDVALSKLATLLRLSEEDIDYLMAETEHKLQAINHME